MILNDAIINEIKALSNLAFDKVKDMDILAALILQKTGRTIGVTTLKRLFGLVNDGHKTNTYTLNTIALFIGYKDWEEYLKTNDLKSVWKYDDETIYIKDLETNSRLILKYLDRVVTLVVIDYAGLPALQVEQVENSSLQKGDILIIHSMKRGESLSAEKVIRGDTIGNYKTKGEISSVEIVHG